MFSTPNPKMALLLGVVGVPMSSSGLAKRRILGRVVN
jgi:hypothetical protein